MNTSVRGRAAIVALAVALVGACGGDDQTIDTTSAPSPTTDTTAPTATTTADGDGVPVDSSASNQRNNNDRSTPMGRLCWSRWEVARTYLTGMTSQPAERRTRLEEVRSALREVDANLAAETEGIPEAVVPFRDRLANDTDNALRAIQTHPDDPTAALRAVSDAFVFPEYPGLPAYEAEAQEAGCSPA